MRRLAPPLLALLVAVAAPASAEEGPASAEAAPTPVGAQKAGERDAAHLFAGEVAVGGAAGSVASLGLTGWDLRLALGGRQYGVPRAMHLPGFDSGTWLIMAGISRSQTAAGLHARGLRLGIGVRLQSGRLTVGLDTEWIQLEVRRVSTGGTLRGGGTGLRLLGALDLIRLGGERAVQAYLEGTVDTFGLIAFGGGGDHTYLPAIHGGIALRW
jgi:hypothetical protein